MLEPDLLRSFIAVADTGSVTEAAARVLRTQSGVSMQMRRLEDLLGRRLFEKAGRGITLSADGELLLGHARRILQAHREVLQLFDGGALEGRVRLGAPDDYATAFLPPVLARFAASHPRVEVEMVVDSSQHFVAAIDAGELDLALITQGSGEIGGTVVHRDQLVWVGARGSAVHEAPVVPLALFHQGCVFRRAALNALAAIGRPSRLAYTSMSMTGVCAAVSAGLAIGVLLRTTVPPGLRVLGEQHGLPALPAIGQSLIRRPGESPTVDALEAQIVAHFNGQDTGQAAA
jgi:DNA-binding transcriptional LysR family regulator